MTRLPDWLADRELLHPGWYTLFTALVAVLLGVLAIGTIDPAAAQKQGMWLGIGLVGLIVATLPSTRVIGRLAYPAMLVVLGLLALLILPGIPRWLVPIRGGATSWIDLGFMALQPSELAKVAFVLALAWYLRHRDNFRTLRGLLVPFVIMFVPVALILKQPDLGTALLFGPTLFAMLLAAGARLTHLGALVGLGLAAVVVNIAVIYVAPDSMQILRPRQRQRIVSMISLASGETKYLDSSAYQQHKSMTLIGAGQLTGYGLERARTVVHHNRLPHDHNDMIFAVIVNRWGLLGGLATVALMTVLIGSVLLVAARTKEPFARLVCVGFGGVMFTQTYINIGVCVGLVPVTGITLPFVSYGGSSLLVSLTMVGLVFNFASRRPAIIRRPSFEFDAVSPVVGRAP